MIQVAKPTIPNTQFKPVSKPVFQETPVFKKINLLPPTPPQPTQVETIKPPLVVKTKPTQMEDILPFVCLAVVAFFVMSRN